MHSRHDFSAQDDPLTRAIAPPQNETIQERDARIHKEREAKRVSEEIDEELSKGQKKGPKPVKILLLGASAFQSRANEDTEGVFVQARVNPVRVRS
jgi:guanine nucleotide-binding protein alpha-1 subunit